jgi:hypothetical protein
MTRRERLLLLAFYAVVLALLARSEPNAVALGGVTGVAAGLAVSGRLRRLGHRMDARLGVDDDQPSGFVLRRPLVRAGLQLLVLGGLLVSTVFLPFVGDELFAASAATATAVPLVVTAARLRR